MRTFLTRLLRLFPAGFRDQFGADMAHQVQEDYDRARARGRLRAWQFAVMTAADLVRSAAEERWRPTWVAAPHESTTLEEEVGRMIAGWAQDLGHAVRTLGRSPGFALVGIATLGLAMGANAGIFSVVSTVLLDPLPFADADRLVYIGASAPGTEFPEEFGVSTEFFVHYRERSALLEDAAIFNAGTSTLRVGERAERVWMSWPTTSLFGTLGATPVLGRLPTPEDESDVVVISHALWTSWFDRDPSVIGRSYQVSGATRTVIGVMGPDFWFPNDDVLLWIPRVIGEEDVTLGRFGNDLVARMVPGATEEELRTELTELARELPERFGGSPSYARFVRERHRPVVRSMEEELLGDVSGPLWVLLGSVAIVLLIACANVANLFIVRGEHRVRDLAVRRALGASRRRLIRIQMAETVVIAGLAGAVAVLLARVGVPVFLSVAPADVPRLDDVALDAPTLLITLAAAALSALLCGLGPAVRASAPALTRLRQGRRGSTRRSHRARDALVVGQTALALVLLIGSGLLVRSFAALRSVDPGYETEDVFTFQIAPEAEDLVDGPSFARFHLDFMDRVAALPAVESVGLVENVPLNEGVSSARFLTEATSPDPEGGALVYFTFAGGDYFGTMDIDVLQGRAFVRSDHVSEHGNVLVSRSAAELLWPGEDAVGRRVRRRDWDGWDTVVGVVEDVLQYGFRDDPQPMIYFPLVGRTPDLYTISSPAYVVKTAQAETIGPVIRAMVRDVAPGAPMYRTFTMDELAADSMVRLSFTALTLGVASVLALVLGAIGLFGVLSYVVAQRTREIGLRMALGAEAGRVRRMVVGQGARVVLLGALIGIAGALATTRLLSGLLFGVPPVDPETFAGMAAAMVLVGLLASYLPARRASRVDPIVSLRAE